MEAKSIQRFIFSGLLLVILFHFGLADDDDDDSLLLEVITDMATGAGIAMCETFVWCQAVMTFVLICTAIISLLMCITMGECPCSAPSAKDFRRAGTAGLGYGAYKLFRH